MPRTKKKSTAGVTVIALEPIPPQGIDRLGGETHGFWSSAKKVTTLTVNEDVLRQNLDAAIQQLQGVLRDAAKRAIEGWRLESITVSFAVSAEGSIGVATAGMEAGIEVTFSPKV